MLKKRGRKGQVTVFMILALVVLLAGSFFFYLSRGGSFFESDYVQPELVPIKNYVENCIKNIADDGLERMGLSGGYIQIPEKISSNPNAYLSEYISSEFKIPYWWYKGIESVPPEGFMQSQLRNYVRNGLDSCINEFEPFNSTFAINDIGDPIVDVQFNEEDTTINLEYNLEVISRGSDFRASMADFRYKSPVRFKKVYELAKSIMERENKDAFLERRTIDLYSLDTEIPTTDIEVRCTAKLWELSKIKEKMRELLRFNIPYIRIQGTSYNPNLYVPTPDGKNIFSKSYYQYHYVWEVDTNPKKYKDMKIAFVYDDWPLEMYARPSQNGVLKSNSEKGSQMLRFFCLNIWHFTYDIEYPVRVAILDEKSGNYQFNFAFKVDIDHNQPSRVNRGTTLFETENEVTSEEYCNDVQNEIAVFTVNNATGEDVKGMNLTFACGRFYCDMGQSDWLGLGAATGVTKRLPYCVLGVVKGAKEEFEDSQMFVQTDVDQRSYVLFANPVKEFSKDRMRSYKVVRHLLSNPSQASDLAPEEKASISITGNSTGFESFVSYPQEKDFPLKLPAGKDGNYQVNILVVDEKNVVGGYIGEWSVAKEKLSEADEIVFHVVSIGASTENERIEFISKLEEHSKSVPKPELKKIGEK